MKVIIKILKSNSLLFILGNFLYNFLNLNKVLIITNSLNYLITKIIKKKKLIIIDIGGNQGESVDCFIKQFPLSKVISFEPLTPSYKKSLLKFKNNKKIKIYNLGIGTTNKKKLYTPVLYNFKLHSWSSSSLFKLKRNLKIHCKNFHYKFKYISSFVKFKKLDSFNFKPDLIKIDVEGMEYQVLKASSKTIKKYKPILLIEINNDINDMKKILIKNKYKTFFIDSNKLKKIDLTIKSKHLNIIAIHKFSKLIPQNKILI